MVFLVVFIFVLFFYIHICYHLKTNNTVEVIYIDYCSCEYVQEICDYRQPVSFSLNLQNTLDKINEALQLYPRYTIQLQKIVNQFIPVNANTIINNPEAYISYRNQNFLQNTGLIHTLQLLDSYIRPITSIYSTYDILFLSAKSYTTFEYNLSYRTFIRVGKGKVKIKLVPPDCKKYMYPVDSFNSFTFHSPINPWNVQPEYTSGYENVISTEIELNANCIIYIPAYWYYSIQAIEDSVLTKHNYWTSMNIISVIPKLIMFAMEKQL